MWKNLHFFFIGIFNLIDSLFLLNQYILAEWPLNQRWYSLLEIHNQLSIRHNQIETTQKAPYFRFWVISIIGDH